jgi:hypothetical protein
MATFGASFNQLEGKIPAILGTLKYLSLMNIDGNNFSGRLPISFCSSQIDAFPMAHIGQVCYPGCFSPFTNKADRESILTRCPGDEDTALCSFINSTNVQAITSQGGSVSRPILLNTQHPYKISDATSVSRLINVPGAVSYTISFFTKSHVFPGSGTYASDFVLICNQTQICSSKSSTPAFGTYTGYNFPGSKGSPPLIIKSSSFYLKFEVNCVQYGT